MTSMLCVSVSLLPLFAYATIIQTFTCLCLFEYQQSYPHIELIGSIKDKLCLIHFKYSHFVNWPCLIVTQSHNYTNGIIYGCIQSNYSINTSIDNILYVVYTSRIVSSVLGFSYMLADGQKRN